MQVCKPKKNKVPETIIEQPDESGEK